MRAFFFSDLHLTDQNSANAQSFLRFLKNLPEDTTHLFLLGDIFDLWVGPGQYFVQSFSQIVEQIKKLKTKNIQIYYFEGNHDLHLQKYWEQQLNVPVYISAEYFTLGPYIVRAEHGDLMNPKDKGYLFLRKFLRSFPMQKLIETIPGSITYKIGTTSSYYSRTHTQKTREQIKEQIIGFTRKHALKTFEESPFDFIITGHTHVEDQFTFERGERKVHSINLGSWFDQPKVMELTPKGYKIIEIS